MFITEIESSDQLDCAPVGTVVRDRDGDIARKERDYPRREAWAVLGNDIDEDGAREYQESGYFTLPVEVIWPRDGIQDWGSL